MINFLSCELKNSFSIILRQYVSTINSYDIKFDQYFSGKWEDRTWLRCRYIQEWWAANLVSNDQPQNSKIRKSEVIKLIDKISFCFSFGNMQIRMQLKPEQLWYLLIISNTLDYWEKTKRLFLMITETNGHYALTSRKMKLTSGALKIV